MADDKVELLIDGRLYAGWEQASVSRAMDAAAGTFSLTVLDRWSGQSEPWDIEPGDACEVRVGGETLITGYVDRVRPRFSAMEHSIQVQGRDRSGDLVDCSAVHDPDEWKNIGLQKLADILAAPFGISVKAETDLGDPIELVKLNHGESVLEAINRHARMRKVLVMPDGRGNILLTRTGARTAAVELVQGRNVLAADGTLDWSERFSEYIVKGQAGYSEDTDGETEAHVEARAEDAYVDRYRPLLLITDTDATNATAQERATWEANTRIGMSAEAGITVQGWRQTKGGPLWEPNMLVTVRLPWLQLEGEMLIRQVTFNKGPGGTTTDLDIVSPQAYAADPPDGKQGKKTKGKKGKKGEKKGNSWMSVIPEDVRNG
ncbi:MAG TPA: hypothetical protein VGE09_11230 [Pseudoxanthomonas sp.]